MPRHTTMKARVQRTPHGDVRLTSRWGHARYYLVASGSEQALRWLRIKMSSEMERNGRQMRIVFRPGATSITVMRDLTSLCAQLQRRWDERLAYDDEPDAPSESDDPHPQFLGLALGRIIDVRQHEIASATLEKERAYVRLWLTVIDPQRPLTDISQERLLEARTALLAVRSKNTVNCAFAVLKSYLDRMVRMGWLSQSPAQDIKKLNDPRSYHDVPWWSQEDVALAIRCARTIDDQARQRAERNRGTNLARNQGRGLDREVLVQMASAELLVAIGCLAGLRVEEIIMQRWQDIDLDARHPRTGRAAPVLHVVPHSDWMPKTGRARTVPICDSLAEVLGRWRQPEAYLLQPAKRMPKRGGTKRVYRYDPRALWQKVVEAVVAAGGCRITPKLMRHSFASNLLMAGESDVKVARWLGHTDTTMVHRHYGHLLGYDEGINRLQIDLEE